jgi:hypothetical protein
VSLFPKLSLCFSLTRKEYLEYLWPQFYHGAFLKTAEFQTSLQLYGQIVEVEATAVMFCTSAAG